MYSLSVGNRFVSENWSTEMLAPVMESNVNENKFLYIDNYIDLLYTVKKFSIKKRIILKSVYEYS